jgi:hypothetical protein
MKDHTVSLNCTLLREINRISNILQSPKLTDKQRNTLTGYKNSKMSQLQSSKKLDPEAFAYSVSLFSPVFLGYLASEDRQNAEMMTSTTTCPSGESSYYITCSCPAPCMGGGCESVCATNETDASSICEIDLYSYSGINYIC